MADEQTETKLEFKLEGMPDWGTIDAYLNYARVLEKIITHSRPVTKQGLMRTNLAKELKQNGVGMSDCIDYLLRKQYVGNGGKYLVPTEKGRTEYGKLIELVKEYCNDNNGYDGDAKNEKIAS